MVSPLYHPDIGGVGRQAIALSEYLAKSGLTVLVMCRKFKGLPDWRPEGEAQVISVPSLGSRKFDLEAKSAVNFLISLSFCLNLMIYLIRHRKEYDIVHFHGASLQLILNVLPLKLMNKKIVAKVAGAKMNIEAGSFRGKYLFLGNLFVRILRSVDMFVAITDEIRIDLIREGYHPERIFKASNFIAPQHFYPEEDSGNRNTIRKRLGINEGKKVITFSGRLVWRKRLDVLLDAVAGVCQKRKDFIVVILGAGELMEDLRRYTAALGITEVVVFRGNVPNVLDYLQVSDLYLLTSETEGMPNSLLEAMACRLPVIATKIGGVVDIVESGRNGILVPPGDVSALRDAILSLLSDTSERERLAVEAYRTIRENYYIEAVASRYADLYRSLLGAV